VKQSQWMKGLLWAEMQIEQSKLICNSEVDVLRTRLYHSGEFSEYFTDFFKGAEDYLKHYEERLK